MHCARCFFYESDVGDETCARCGRAYMPEANVYLGLMLFVTGGLAWTLRALLTGSADPLVRPTLDSGAWATWPVSMVDQPVYGFLIGAFLAMLAVAPILTAVMYGKRGGWLLVLVIALIGPARAGASAATLVVPTAVFAGALGLGVWIAAGQTLRLGSKLASVLLGLVPVAVYWFVETARSNAEALAPTLRGMVYLVPVTAVATAAGAAALVVAVGWADRWHVRWPGALLAVLTAGPVLALLAFVGLDEIRYRLLPEPTSIGTVQRIEAYQDFIDRYPSSPRGGVVRARLAKSLEARQARGEDVPHDAPSPEQLWREVLERYPESLWAEEARVHLADAAAARGLFDDARRLYRETLERTRDLDVPEEDPLADFSVLRDVFTIGERLRARETARHLRAIRRQTLLRFALLRENRCRTENGSRALARYFQALAYEGTNKYRAALLEAKEADPEGMLADNIACELARFEADPNRRLELLEEVAASYAGTDGAMQAHLAAADDLIERAAKAPGAWRRARAHLLDVQRDLARRKAANPQDPYVAVFADLVDTRLAYVQARLRSPEHE